MSKILKNILFIIIILTILILSQQSYFEGWGRNIYQKVEKWGEILWQKCKEFWNKHILHRVTTEIEKRQEIAKEELKKETKEISLTAWQKIKNYISGLFRGIFNQASQENK